MSKAPLSQMELLTRHLPERSVLRQRIVETERGFTAGFRANSAFFFYFFTTSVLISFAVVLGLSGMQWALMILSVTVAISSELLYFCVQKLKEKLNPPAEDEEYDQLFAMTTAGCMLLLTGSIATIITLLVSRLYSLYG